MLKLLVVLGFAWVGSLLFVVALFMGAARACGDADRAVRDRRRFTDLVLAQWHSYGTN